MTDDISDHDLMTYNVQRGDIKVTVTFPKTTPAALALAWASQAVQVSVEGLIKHMDTELSDFRKAVLDRWNEEHRDADLASTVRAHDIHERVSAAVEQANAEVHPTVEQAAAER